MRHITLIIALVALAIAAPAIADKGGSPHGGGGGGSGAQQSSAGCTVNPSPAAIGQTYVVTASGLPTGTAVNLWVTDPSGNTSGSPLGSTPDGTFTLNESSSSGGTWTYTFSGPTKNNTGTTAVYASCSVSAS
jgi:hypothetical protein